MKISIAEAATILGKSERQVRYLIKTGKLTASKQGGRWQIDSNSLPLSEKQRQAMAGRLETARTAFEKGVEPAAKVVSGKGEKRQRYSVCDLTAFQSGETIYREGSIRYYGKSGWPRLIRVDYHGSKEVPTGTCHSILKAAGLK